MLRHYWKVPQRCESALYSNCWNWNRWCKRGNCNMFSRTLFNGNSLWKYISVQSGFDRILYDALGNGLVYVGISAGSMYAAGNLADGLHVIDNPIIPHWNSSETTAMPNGNDEIKLADGKAVYVEDNYISVIWCTCRDCQIPISNTRNFQLVGVSPCLHSQACFNITFKVFYDKI